MCGRYALWDGKRELDWLFGIKISEELKPRYNIAPSQQVPIVREKTPDDRELAFVRWGLIPPWADDPKKLRLSLFNARAEGVAQKPTFRTAFRKRRCLIPVSGFYEWQQRADHKQPFFTKAKDGHPLALAGLWEKWERDGQQIESCTIITTRADSLLKPIHDRMPAIIPREHFAAWLDPTVHEADFLEEFLAPAPAGWLEVEAVSTTVNNVRNEGPELVEPLG
jgi:putative SOS response-associated peptidase YedK